MHIYSKQQYCAVCTVVLSSRTPYNSCSWILTLTRCDSQYTTCWQGAVHAHNVPIFSWSHISFVHRRGLFWHCRGSLSLDNHLAEKCTITYLLLASTDTRQWLQQHRDIIRQQTHTEIITAQHLLELLHTSCISRHQHNTFGHLTQPDCGLKQTVAQILLKLTM